MSSPKDPENAIAYAGIPGANTDIACRNKHPYMETFAVAAFEDVFEAVENGTVKYGMIPIENSQAGRVAEIHSLLPTTKLHVVDEYILPIEHQLCGIKGATLDEITEVYSHPQALMQCRKTLRDLGKKPMAHPDTAMAAEEVGQWGDKTKGAVCSELAATLYGLEVLHRDAQDAENNRTHFITLSREPVDPDPKKEWVLTSVLFTTRSIPAALYKCLGGFATNNVNLLKLESYMGVGMSGDAQFFITFEGHPEEKSVQLALQELGFFSNRTKVLGVYPADTNRK